MYGLTCDVLNNRYCYIIRSLSFNGYHYEICPDCGRQIALEKPSNPNLGFVVEGGSLYPDFLGNCDADICFIVSERVLETFVKHEITGYDQAKKVTVYREKHGMLSKQECSYYSLNITGNIDLNLKSMSLKRKHYCPRCDQFDWNIQRLHILKSSFDMDTWDGSDLCRVASFPRHIICSKKIKSIIEEYKFKGVYCLEEDSIFKPRG